MLHTLLAHAQEFHDDTTNVIEHNATEPIGFIAAVLVGIGVIVLLSRLLHWHKGTTTLLLLGLFLTAGIFGYTYLPALGALLIAVGITLALAFVLLGLASERDNTN